MKIKDSKREFLGVELWLWIKLKNYLMFDYIGKNFIAFFFKLAVETKTDF